MQLFADSTLLQKVIGQLMRDFDYYSWSVAWASSGHPLFTELLKSKERIKQMVVGTHFYQTDPNFMRNFFNSEKVRFVLNTNGVYHPKIYLFENSDKWACILGSANFTGGAFRENKEACVLFDSTDKNSDQIFNDLKKRMALYWEDGSTLTEQYLENYERQYRLQSKKHTALSGRYGDRTVEKSPIELEIFNWSWEQFFEKVRKDPFHSLKGRLSVLKSARRLFQKISQFNDMKDEERCEIAGFRQEDSVPWLWFGSMKGAGEFKKQILSNNPYISRALDRIPLNGIIQRKHFENYIQEFCRAFPNGRDGIATATRLLAMKRPDYFVCLDSKNRNALCKAFGIMSSNMDYVRYWDKIIERMQNTVWWNAPKPEDEQGGDVWEGRAAFMDALFYVE